MANIFEMANCNVTAKRSEISDALPWVVVKHIHVWDIFELIACNVLLGLFGPLTIFSKSIIFTILLILIFSGKLFIALPCDSVHKSDLFFILTFKI